MSSPLATSTFTAASVGQHAGRRRVAAVLGIAVALALSIWPRQYTARVKIMPPQSSQAGLGALLGQLGGLASFANMVGGRQPTEVYLLLARSNDVAEDVLKRLAALKDKGADMPDSSKDLWRWVDVHTLRGGVVEIESSGGDSNTAKAITVAWAAAFQDRLSVLAREEIGRKKQLMSEKLHAASTQLAQAEAALTRFRTTKRIASAEGQLSASVGLLASLHGKLQAKEVELDIARQFMTPQNITERRIQAEVNSLRKQIAETQSADKKVDPFAFQSFTADTSDYVRLYRDLKYAEALFEVYARFSESINVEEMSSGLNAQVVESPYVDPNLKLRAWALGLAGLIALAAVWAELAARSRASRPAVSDWAPELGDG